MSSPVETPAAYLTDLDPETYKALARYCFDGAECHPSQQLMASDLDVARETVNRSIRRLASEGVRCVLIKEKVWSPFSGWQYNVYELLQPYNVADVAKKRIIRRAHRRAYQRARAHSRRRAKARYEALRRGQNLPFCREDHTKWLREERYGVQECQCRHCRDEGWAWGNSIQRAPPWVLRPSEVMRAHLISQVSPVRAMLLEERRDHAEFMRTMNEVESE